MSAQFRLRPKIIHRAALIDPNGNVSPLCAKTPRAINLRRATWTIQDEAVTCQKCRRKIMEAAP